MNVKKAYYATLAETVIANLKKRNMDGLYFDTKEEATNYILSLIPSQSSISWGGSMTLEEVGLIEALHKTNRYDLLDRAKVAPEEIDSLYRQVFSCDYFLMSSNAITQDGKLVNVDGTGNRVAALIFGPKHVLVVAGMNKVVPTEADARNRVQNIASPQNTIRINKNTPCAKTGVCHDCLSPDCICMQTVITRNSRNKDRIKVILIGESLGY